METSPSDSIQIFNWNCARDATMKIPSFRSLSTWIQILIWEKFTNLTAQLQPIKPKNIRNSQVWDHEPPEFQIPNWKKFTNLLPIKEGGKRGKIHQSDYIITATREVMTLIIIISKLCPNYARVSFMNFVSPLRSTLGQILGLVALFQIYPYYFYLSSSAYPFFLEGPCNEIGDFFISKWVSVIQLLYDLKLGSP